MHAVYRFMLEFIEIVFFFMQTHEKKTQLGNYVLCARSAFLRQSNRMLPSLKTTTARGLIGGFFDLKHVREPYPVHHYPVPLSAADIISSVGPRVGPGRHPQRGCEKLIQQTVWAKIWLDKMLNVLFQKQRC